MAFPGKLYREGNTLKQENVSGHPKYFFVEQFGFNNFLDNAILGWIDTLAANGVNGTRVFGIWPFAKGNEEEPWVKAGNQYNLDQLNERYFTHLKEWVKYAYDRGIAVLFELFDSCGFWAAEYAQYNPFYHVVGGNHLAFSDLNNGSLVAIQKRYVQKVVETVNPYCNVIFGIMNEFVGDAQWHYEMSRYVKSLAPDALVSGSSQGSTATRDPKADLWFVHKGTYDIKAGRSNVRADNDGLRGETGDQKILGYSTDGFGQSGKFRENPTDMRNLARDVVNTNLQLFGFLDHKAYNELGGGSVNLLNVESYQAIVGQFLPYPLPKKGAQFKLDDQSFISLKKKNVPPDILKMLEKLKDKEYDAEEEFVSALEATIGKAQTTQYKTLIVKYAAIGRQPDGFLDIFSVHRLPSTHPAAYIERGGKAIRATTEQGFLCFGQYKKGYPTIPLQALFSILIDDNTADDRNILILDVYDHQSDRVLGKKVITRKDFPKANDFSLFKFDFTPPSKDANMEFRIYYLGHAYVLADKIAVIDPTEITVNEASEIPNPTAGVTPSTPTTGETGLPDKPVIFDPLIDGKSIGTISGGLFTSEGYKITSTYGGYILYQTNVIRNIGLEFDAKGYLPNEDFGENKMALLLMYDADPYTDWRAVWQHIDSFLYQLRKRGFAMDGNQVHRVTNGLGLKFGCARRGVDVELGSWNPGQALCRHPVEWDPNKVYHWVITAANGLAEVIRNGEKMYSVRYTNEFVPDKPLVVCIGGTTYGAGGPRDVTYSNVKIYQL